MGYFCTFFLNTSNLNRCIDAALNFAQISMIEIGQIVFNFFCGIMSIQISRYRYNKIELFSLNRLEQKTFFSFKMTIFINRFQLNEELINSLIFSIILFLSNFTFNFIYGQLSKLCAVHIQPHTTKCDTSINIDC